MTLGGFFGAINLVVLKTRNMAKAMVVRLPSDFKTKRVKLPWPQA